ncbi:MAG TPA: hypothetical protein VHC70_14430 [Phycisphaerales bacterium]|jgi:hypothetical protein|nr:hypothetical protein [Phycisphaerales bacterium]
MGTWSLDSVTGKTSDFTTGELFGTNVIVTFRVRYRSSTIGSFQETPKLDWHEKFIMKEHHNGDWWEFESNMYEHNPCSNTLKIWAGRYIHAYKHAMGRPDLGTKGSSKLLTASGSPVAAKDLTQNLSDGKAMADAVRSYLKSNGGILEITIHDIPSINKPKGAEHKERLLKFRCGIVGGGQTFTGEQYLDVDAAKPESSWLRDFSAAHPTFSTGTLKKVPAPASVSSVRAPNFLGGECW